MRQIATYSWLYNHHFYIYRSFRGCLKRYFSETLKKSTQKCPLASKWCKNGDAGSLKMVTDLEISIWFMIQALTAMKSLEYWKRCQLLTRNVLGVIRLYTTVKIFTVFGLLKFVWGRILEIIFTSKIFKYSDPNPKRKPVSKSNFNLVKLAIFL